jgi:hypothetical protein
MRSQKRPFMRKKRKLARASLEPHLFMGPLESCFQLVCNCQGRNADERCQVSQTR